MKLLMISRDIKVVEKSSKVYERLVEYSKLFEELHVIVFGKGKKVLKFQDKNLYIYPALSKNIFFSFLNGLSLSFFVSSKIKRDSVVTVQDPFESGIVGILIKKIFGLRLQVQVHTDFLSENYFKHSLKNKLHVFIGKAIIQEADTIRVVSEKIKKDIELFFKDKRLTPKISVLPIFVDIDEIKRKISGAQKISFGTHYPVILSVSRLESEKNVSLIIKSFARLLKQEPRAILVVVGDGSERGVLERLAEYLKIGDRVKFALWQDDVYKFYALSNLFISTSYYEGFGIALLEAAIAGLPIVSTDVGIARELGANITSYDSGEIVNTILKELKKEKRNYNLEQFMKTKREYLLQFKDTFNI